jgi:hypothetical protein
MIPRPGALCVYVLLRACFIGTTIAQEKDLHVQRNDEGQGSALYNSLCDDLTHVKRWLYSSGISASIDVTGDLLAAEREPFRELLSRSVRCDSSYLLLGCKTLSRVDFNTPLNYYEPLSTRLYVGAARLIQREMARLRGRESGE